MNNKGPLRTEYPAEFSLYFAKGDHSCLCSKDEEPRFLENLKRMIPLFLGPESKYIGHFDGVSARHCPEFIGKYWHWFEELFYRGCDSEYGFMSTPHPLSASSNITIFFPCHITIFLTTPNPHPRHDYSFTGCYNPPMFTGIDEEHDEWEDVDSMIGCLTGIRNRCLKERNCRPSLCKELENSQLIYRQMTGQVW